MIIELVDKKEYKKMMLDFYSEDTDFVEKYNAGEGNGIDEQIKKSIKTFSDLDELSIFSISENNIIIAYFGKKILEGNGYLVGFFIKKEYRNSNFYKFFFNTLKNYFENKPIYCTLHQDNTRAIRFILKNGILIDSDDKLLTFKIN
jgi:hypothetical protein